jgi:hypothetical protein
MEVNSRSSVRTWAFATSLLAILALVISAWAFYFSYRADVVELGSLSGDPLLDSYRAQVEELQRSNDRLLNSIWAIMGTVVALSAILVTFNFVRGERVIEREREFIEERFGYRLSAETERITARDEHLAVRLDDFERQFAEIRIDASNSSAQLLSELDNQRRRTAGVEFQLYEMQYWIYQIGRSFDDSVQGMGAFWRADFRKWNERFTALAMFNSAFESDEDWMISLALYYLHSMVKIPMSDNDYFPAESLAAKVRTLPDRFNPTRDEILNELEERLSEPHARYRYRD